VSGVSLSQPFVYFQVIVEVAVTRANIKEVASLAITLVAYWLEIATE
jgi:hypothetical protein